MLINQFGILSFKCSYTGENQSLVRLRLAWWSIGDEKHWKIE